MNFPLPLMKIVEDIASDLPESESQGFTAAITAAAEGKDLSLAHWVFLGEELRALPDDLPCYIQALIDQLIAGIDRLAAGKEWREAAEVAYDAAITVKAASKAAAYTPNAASYAAAYAASAAAAGAYRERAQ